MANRRSLVLRQVTEGASKDAILEDFKQLGQATKNLGYHAAVAASQGHFGFLRWLATIAAIFLIAVDRTNWKTDIHTGLLIPYIWLNLPPIIFHFVRGEFGKWVSLIAVIVRLFIPHRFPDEAELPVCFFLLTVVAPHVLAVNLRNSIFGVILSLIIGAYLLQQHIRNAGGFRNAFAQHGIPNTIGIILLFVSPIVEFIHYV